MTATPIEARSLSSLTSLFANPPQYPRNPTHQILDPLVLYIVRVPGSQDVFLTPLKASTKSSISAEAINASLYYLHVTTHEDEIVKQSLELDKRSLEAERSAPVQIARKPLPPSPFANYPASQRPPPPPKAYPHFQRPAHDDAPDTQLARQAARAQHIRFNSASNVSGSVPRKPVGPRPLHSSSYSLDSGLPERKPVGREGKYEQLLAALGQNGRESFDTSLDEARPDTEQGLHITLIRRDPSSSAQWNIGSLSREKRRPNSHQNTFKIDITTPGYQKFAKQAGLVSFFEPTYGASSRPATPASTDSTTPTPGQTIPFTREVSLTQPRSIILPRSSYDRRGSEDVSPYDNLGLPVNSKASPRSHHFTFASPWQGTCIFVTGMNGRSLKCRHTLPPSTSGHGGETATVAELRFNLPWSVLKSKDANAKNLIRAAHTKSPSLSSLVGGGADTWKRGMQKIKENRQHSRDPRGHARLEYDSEPGAQRAAATAIATTHDRNSNSNSGSGSDSDEHSAHLGLRLGREKAGGGRKGKSAKLGKLIIEDEGLKMCDLVVAASMAVWWQHYARV